MILRCYNYVEQLGLFQTRPFTSAIGLPVSRSTRGISHCRDYVVSLVPPLLHDQGQQQRVEKCLLYRVRPSPSVSEAEARRGSQQVLQGPLLQHQT